MCRGLVAIIGGPNVGKSCLYNRLLGRREAIVEKSPGVTRDRLYRELVWKGKKIKLVDTGGLELGSSEKLKQHVFNQVKFALEEAELILLVCDIKSGVTVLDKEISQLLRKADRRVLLVVNKVDNHRLKEGINDFFSLGLGSPLPVSAMHGLGIGGLLDEIVNIVSEVKIEDFIGLKVAIVGRPNVGKSSYLNALLEEERVVVDERPGTTRDAVDTLFVKEDKKILLIDTAGIKHKSKLRTNLEFYSILRSREAIERADVSLILIDAYEGLRKGDIQILGYVRDKGKGSVLIVNKWDLVTNISQKEYINLIKKNTRLTQFIPILFCSAIEKQNILQPIEWAEKIYSSAGKIPTSQLNRLLNRILKQHPPPAVGGRRPKFFYISQSSVHPPTFKIFVSEPGKIRSSYTHFLENCLHKEFGFLGYPIKLIYKARERN